MALEYSRLQIIAYITLVGTITASRGVCNAPVAVSGLYRIARCDHSIDKASAYRVHALAAGG